MHFFTLFGVLSYFAAACGFICVSFFWGRRSLGNLLNFHFDICDFYRLIIMAL